MIGLLAAFGLLAADATGDATALAGAWTVDLSVDPSQPYTKPMNLTLNADGTVDGLFYQSDIEAGRWISQNGRTCVSFRTSDGQTPYHTAACLNGEVVEGQTWAEDRDFLFLWKASRSTDAEAE